MTQDSKNSASAAAAASPLAQLLSQIRMGGQPLNAEQLEFAEYIGQTILNTFEGQKLQAELARDMAAAKADEMKALSIEIGLMSMQREAKIQARLAAAPLRFTLYDEVTVGSMDLLNRQMLQASDMHPGHDMVLHMNTPGGSVLDGMAGHDNMLILRSKPRKHHLTIIGLGVDASMGSILIMAADWRVLGPNAEFLIHAPSGGRMQDLIDIWDRMSVLLTARKGCKWNPRTLSEKVKAVGDWKMTAQQAKDEGFVDDVLEVPDPSISTPPPKLQAVDVPGLDPANGAAAVGMGVAGNE